MAEQLDWQYCQKVFVWIHSANRDPAQLSNPNQFDITQTLNYQLAFGHGIHYCLGAPLARIDNTLVLKMMREQLRDLQHADIPAIATEAGTIVGVKQLPVVFVLSKPVS
jgi:cytochrome P450